MKSTSANVLAAGLLIAASTAATASDRVVGSSNHDRGSANEALDRAEENAPETADKGLSTAREAVNNNGLGPDHDTVADRARNHSGAVGGSSRASSRGAGGGQTGSRGGSANSGGGRGR